MAPQKNPRFEKRKPADEKDFSWFEATISGGTLILTIVKTAAELIAVPYLAQAANTTLNIISIVQVLEDNKNDCQALMIDATDIVVAIFRSYDMAEDQTAWPGKQLEIQDIVKTLEETLAFVEAQASRKIFFRVLERSKVVQAIKRHRVKLQHAISRFELSSHLELHETLRLMQKTMAQMKEKIDENSSAENEPEEHVADQPSQGPIEAFNGNFDLDFDSSNFDARTDHSGPGPARGGIKAFNANKGMKVKNSTFTFTTNSNSSSRPSGLPSVLNPPAQDNIQTPATPAVASDTPSPPSGIQLFEHGKEIAIDRSSITATQSTTINIYMLPGSEALGANLQHILHPTNRVPFGESIPPARNPEAEGNDREGGRRAPADLPPPHHKLPENRKILFYTGVDTAAMRLRRKTDIVLTLTPRGLDVMKDAEPIIWKVLSFSASGSHRQMVHWTSRVGFALVKEKRTELLIPTETIEIQPGGVGILAQSSDEGHPCFQHSSKTLLEGTNDIAIYNTLDTASRILLCTIEPELTETGQFSPVVHLPLREREGPRTEGIGFSFPVMLQAYTVASKTPLVGKIFKRDELGRPLFVDESGNEKPLDVSHLHKEQTNIRLYTNNYGNTILKRM